MKCYGYLLILLTLAFPLFAQQEITNWENWFHEKISAAGGEPIVISDMEVHALIQGFLDLNPQEISTYLPMLAALLDEGGETPISLVQGDFKGWLESKMAAPRLSRTEIAFFLLEASRLPATETFYLLERLSKITHPQQISNTGTGNGNACQTCIDQKARSGEYKSSGLSCEQYVAAAFQECMDTIGLSIVCAIAGMFDHSDCYRWAREQCRSSCETSQ